MIQRLAPIFFAFVIAVAVVGYFVGIAEGVPDPDGFEQVSMIAEFERHVLAADPKLVPSITYAEVPATSMGPTETWAAKPSALPILPYDLYAEIKPNEAEKEASLKLRASRRAFNGAPPVIAHPVENTTDAACYACHGNGMRMAGLRASVMSHQFLGNCVQCHAPMAPEPFRDIDATVESTFVGLPAPKAGQRAYPGAPPMIPHSQWMRENCKACHGAPNGWPGLESTHLWRTNCTQCHAPSATLDQMPAADTVPMLPPLNVDAD